MVSVDAFLQKHNFGINSSRKNNLRVKALYSNQLLTLQEACQVFNVPKSILITTAMETKVTTGEQLMVNAWQARNISEEYKSSISICGASDNLGLPKSTIIHLLSSGVFEQIDFVTSTSNAGRLSKKEIEHFNRKVFANSEHTDTKQCTRLPKLLHHFGYELHHPLIAIIEAIKQGKITAKRTNDNGLKSYWIDHESFEHWLTLTKRRAKGLSIQEASKYMGIDYCTVSQLIEAELLEHHRYGKGELKHITFDQIRSFNQTYALSSKLRDLFDMGRKALHKYLAEQGISSIELPNNSQREQVYKWADINQLLNG
jgi:hypothetical protein